MTIRRRQLLASTLLTAAALFASAPAAFAQNDDGTIVEELVVTGTRLRLPDYTSPAPVASVTGEAIEQAGVTNLVDFLTDVPALVTSTTLQDNADAGNRSRVGLNLLNLRGLGTQRTLVLVNGRRHVAATTEENAVDVNSIPIGLIDRIEVLTGGASAVYGADGVTGVVNFILKRDFEGIDARAQYGVSDEGGAENTFLSILGGKNLLDGRINVTLAGEYSKTGRLSREDRHFSALATAEGRVRNPDYVSGENFQQIFSRNTRYIDSSPGGSLFTDVNFGQLFFDVPGSLAGPDFQGNGAPWQDGTYTSGFTMIGGSGSQTAAFGTDLVPELERATLHGTFLWELTPKHRMFGEAKHTRTWTQFQSQPTFDYALRIPIDNPYIPAAARANALGPNGLAANGFEDEDYGLFLEPGYILVTRDNFDLGFVTRDVQRDTTRFVLGFEGDLTDHLRYEISGNYGQTLVRNTEGNNRINERFYAAIDAVDEGAFLRGVPNGNIVCRSNLDPTAVPFGTDPSFGPNLYGGSPFDQDTFGTTFTPGANSGCVPANIFGEGNVSQAAKDWMFTSSKGTDLLRQVVFNGFLSGDTTPWFELPAGPVSFVLGAEYRYESATLTPSADELLGGQIGYDVTWLGQGQVTSGKYNVKEVFGEVSVPIIKDVFLVQDLTLEGAYRYSDYSTIGTTDTWRAGLKWEVSDSLMFRGTIARSVRAPNISELYQPQLQTFDILVDPCDDDEFQAGDRPEIREANCRAALGIGANAPYTFNNNSSSSIEGVVGGNPDLGPEAADTWTVGFAYTPTYFKGFSLSLDYYDIELTNAIQTFSAQSILDKCYDLPQPNQFCGLISRAPGSNLVTSFQQFSVNVASYNTSGYDLSIRYQFDPRDWGLTKRDLGSFGITLQANKLEELTFIEDPSDPLSIDETVGDAFVPEWQGTLDLTWQYKNFGVNYGYNWFDKTIRYPNRPADYIDPQYVYYSERSTHDIQVNYTFGEADRYMVYGGVNNIGDQEPDRGLRDYPVGPIGRYFYGGVRLRM